MINPGKGLPLFPSEQFWSLQVTYCDPAGKKGDESFKTTSTMPASLQSRLFTASMLIAKPGTREEDCEGQSLF